MSHFHWADYLVFVAMLVISISTGIYFAYKSRNHQDAEEFLMAGRNMHVLPVAFSIFVSWMSGISIIGDPVECYRYGFIYMLLVAGYIVGTFLASFFAPKFHEMRITSAYEFLELRYSKGMRLACSTAGIIAIVMWLGIATYAPALAISQASGIPVWLSIIMIGAVCTFYTSIGGMKAVLWADTIQMAIMFAGQVAIVVRGCIRVGGVAEVFRIAAQGGRLNFKESLTDFNPLARASLWTFFFGGIARVFTPYISNQLWIQRFCTVRTPRDARVAVLLSIPMFAVMSSMIGLGGLIMYAVYSDCDPVLNGEVERWDQMVPYLVIDLLSFLPGVPGLFMATIFAASLSSLSSGMNAIAAMLLTDFASPLYKHCTGEPLSSKLETILAKLFAFVAGVALTSFAFVPFLMGSSIFVITSLVVGVVFGPTAGVFFVALCMPAVKSVFVHIAYFVAMVLCSVVGILTFILPPRGPWEELPLTTSGCPHINDTSEFYNITSRPTTSRERYIVTTTIIEKPPFSFKNIHEMNALLYNLLGLVSVIVVAGTLHILSCCKDCWTERRRVPHYEPPSRVQYDYVRKTDDDKVKKPVMRHNSKRRRNVSMSMRSVRTLSERGTGRLSRHSYMVNGSSADGTSLRPDSQQDYDVPLSTFR